MTGDRSTGYRCALALLLIAACGDNQTADEGPRLASGVGVEAVNFYQTAEIPLAAGGQVVTKRDAPIIIGRDAAVRVIVRGVASAEPRDATIHVRLHAGTATREYATTVSILAGGAASTALVELPGIDIGVDTRMSIAIYEADGAPGRDGDTSQATWPRGFTLPLQARDPGTFHLVLVPIVVPGASPSMVDLTPTLVDTIAGDVRNQMAIRDLDLTVREPITWIGDPGIIADWGAFILHMAFLRESDGVADNVMYYGVLPAVPGLAAGGVAPVLRQDPFWRASFGLLGGPGSGILLHEVIHVLGQAHAPCGGPANPDPSYPYAAASIGAPGWDSRTGLFKDPAEIHDTMSYCPPTWPSDYTFAATFRAIEAMNITSANAARVREQRTVYAYAVDKGNATFIGRHTMPTAGARLMAVSGAAPPTMETVRLHDSSAVLVLSQQPLGDGVHVPDVGPVTVAGGAR